MASSEPLAAGIPAPDFELKGTMDQTVSLREFRGKNVVLAFYPYDWSPVCSDQLSLYQQLLPEFERLDAVVFGISVDSTWSHIAYAENRNLHFPLLSDFNPRGEVSSAFGVFDEASGSSKRGLFVIDRAGVIAWSHLSPNSVNPGADGILDALEALHVREAA